MKKIEMFRARIALKKVRVGSIAGATAMWIHSSKPHAMFGACVHGPPLMKPKLFSRTFSQLLSDVSSISSTTAGILT